MTGLQVFAFVVLPLLVAIGGKVAADYALRHR